MERNKRKKNVLADEKLCRKSKKKLYSEEEKVQRNFVTEALLRITLQNTDHLDPASALDRTGQRPRRGLCGLPKVTHGRTVLKIPIQLAWK